MSKKLPHREHGAVLAIIDEWVAWRKVTSGPNTVSTQLYMLKQWFRQLQGGKASVGARISTVHERDVDAFVNTKDKTSRSTRNSRLAALRSLFEYAQLKGYTPHGSNVAKLVTVRLRGFEHSIKETKHRKPVTETEYHTLMEDAEGFTRYAIAMGYWLGQRLSDIACFEWASYDSKAERITVWTMKRDTRVTLDLKDPLYGGGIMTKLLAELWEEKKPGARGIPPTPFPFPIERATVLSPQRANLSVYMGRHFERCNIKGKTFHCLRHSFASRLKAGGLTVAEVGAAMGHSPAGAATTEGYIHTDPVMEILADI